MRSDLEAAFAAAARCGDTAVRDLAALLVTVDGAGDPALVAVAREHLLRAPGRLWSVLDRVVRLPLWLPRPWAVAARERVTAGTAGPLSRVVASASANGYVREAVVADLAADPDPLVLPALALRCADWVAPVREAARRALAARVAADRGALAVVAPVAFALGSARSDWLSLLVLDAYRTDRAALETALRSPDDGVRRVAFHVAVATGGFGPDRLVAFASRDRDAVVRRRATDAAARLGDPERLRPLLDAGTAYARATAVGAIGQAGDTAPAYAALADRNATVRAVAQAVLRRAGADVAGAYRALLAGGATPGVVAGLGETGDETDVPLLRDLLGATDPRVRAAAVGALDRRGAATLDLLVPLLRDDAPAVVRQAARALRPVARQVDRAHLLRLLDPARLRHVRVAAYRVLRDRGTWERVRVDIDRYNDLDAELRRRARADLSAWLATGAAESYAAPDDETRAAIAAGLVRLDPATARVVAFHARIRP